VTHALCVQWSNPILFDMLLHPVLTVK